MISEGLIKQLYGVDIELQRLYEGKVVGLHPQVSPYDRIIFQSPATHCMFPGERAF